MLPAEQLKTIPLFAQLTEEQLAHLAPLFHHARYGQGDFVTRQEEMGDAFFVLEHGTLRVQDVEDEVSVPGYLTAPAFFGEPSLFEDALYDVTIEVVSVEADLSVLHRSEFEQLLLRYPDIRDRLSTSLDEQPVAAQGAYPWLFENEVVLVNTRRHWYALVSRLLTPLLFSLAFLLVWALLQAVGTRLPALANNSWMPSVSAGLVVFALVTLLGGFVWEGLDWANDYYVVTNMRVIHIEKTIFVYDEREEAPIEMITNVVELTQGFAPRIFGFVDLRVETAGRQVEIDFTHAPRTAQIHQTIFEQMSRARERAASERRARVRAGIRKQLRGKLAPDGSEAEVLAAASDVFQPKASALEPMQSVRLTGLGRFLRSAFALRVDEPHQVTWHKHWFDLFGRLSKPLVALAVLLAVLGAFASGLVPWSVTTSLGDPFLGPILVAAGWILLACLVVFWLWYQYADWDNDLYRVTTDRVVDLERSPFGFEARSVETMLERVQDISYAQHGPLQVLFNYGDVSIETAGAGRIVFYSIQNPRAATQEVFRRREAYRAARQMVESEQRRSEFLDWFVEYHQLLKDKGGGRQPGTRHFQESTATAGPPAELT